MIIYERLSIGKRRMFEKIALFSINTFSFIKTDVSISCYSEFTTEYVRYDMGERVRHARTEASGFRGSFLARDQP